MATTQTQNGNNQINKQLSFDGKDTVNGQDTEKEQSGRVKSSKCKHSGLTQS